MGLYDIFTVLLFCISLLILFMGIFSIYFFKKRIVRGPQGPQGDPGQCKDNDLSNLSTFAISTLDYCFLSDQNNIFYFNINGTKDNDIQNIFIDNPKTTFMFVEFFIENLVENYTYELIVNTNDIGFITFNFYIYCSSTKITCNIDDTSSSKCKNPPPFFFVDGSYKKENIIFKNDLSHAYFKLVLIDNQINLEYTSF